jgi:hypothetical protein
VTTQPLALQRDLTRKAIHLLGTTAPIVYATGMSRSVLLSILGCGAAMAIAVEIGRRMNDAVQRVLDRATTALCAWVLADLPASWALSAGVAAAVAEWPRCGSTPTLESRSSSVR